MAHARGRGDRPRRLIFSRKGFDSGYGGRPSPILASDVMVSLPIPEAGGGLSYSQCLTPTGETYQELLIRLGIERIRSPGGSPPWLDVRDDPGVHLDPDLNANALPREAGWRPLFGQVGASQTHLSRCGVSRGDVFLFFGWFCPVDDKADGLRYRSRREQLQAIFGWLEIGQVLAVRRDEIPQWAHQHPHVRDQVFDRYRLHNTLYVASAESTLAQGMAGAGIFRWNPSLRLTKPGETPSVWQLPRTFHPDYTSPASLTYHRREAWALDAEYATLRSARIGQEFVITMTPAIEAWARDLLALGT